MTCRGKGGGKGGQSKNGLLYAETIGSYDQKPIFDPWRQSPDSSVVIQVSVAISISTSTKYLQLAERPYRGVLAVQVNFFWSDTQLDTYNEKFPASFSLNHPGD